MRIKKCGDNGYGNVKTAHRVFSTGIIKCDSEPVLSKEYIEYDGAYYIIGEGNRTRLSIPTALMPARHAR